MATRWLLASILCEKQDVLNFRVNLIAWSNYEEHQLSAQTSGATKKDSAKPACPIRCRQQLLMSRFSAKQYVNKINKSLVEVKE